VFDSSRFEDIYTAIFNIPLKEMWAVFLLVAIVCGGLLSKAYETVATSTYTAISRNRCDGCEHSLTLIRGLLAADLDVLSKGQKKQQHVAKSAALAEKRDLTRQEALSFSVLYNNALFLALVVLFAFYLFKTVPGVVYPTQIALLPLTLILFFLNSKK
jgi:hypothetical protein